MNAVLAAVTCKQKTLTVTSYMNTPILPNHIYPTINSGLSGEEKRLTLAYRKIFTNKFQKVTTSNVEKACPPLGTLAMHNNGDTSVTKATSMTSFIYQTRIMKMIKKKFHLNY